MVRLIALCLLLAGCTRETQRQNCSAKCFPFVSTFVWSDRKSTPVCICATAEPTTLKEVEIE